METFQIDWQNEWNRTEQDSVRISLDLFSLIVCFTIPTAINLKCNIFVRGIFLLDLFVIFFWSELLNGFYGKKNEF